MREKRAILIIGFILLQALLLTQIDCSLAVMPSAGIPADILHHHKSEAPRVPWLALQNNQAAYMCFIVAWSSQLPAQGLAALRISSAGAQYGPPSVCGALLTCVFKVIFGARQRVLLDGIPRIERRWAHAEEAVGPPCARRRLAASDVIPNC